MSRTKRCARKATGCRRKNEDKTPAANEAILKQQTTDDGIQKSRDHAAKIKRENVSPEENKDEEVLRDTVASVEDLMLENETDNVEAKRKSDVDADAFTDDPEELEKQLKALREHVKAVKKSLRRIKKRQRSSKHHKRRNVEDGGADGSNITEGNVHMRGD